MAGADLRTGGLDKADHALAATLGGAAADLPPPEQVEALSVFEMVCPALMGRTLATRPVAAAGISFSQWR
jgi:hypothetical protein